MEERTQIMCLAGVCAVGALVFFISSLLAPRVFTNTEDYICEAFRIDLFCDALVYGAYRVACAVILFVRRKYGGNTIWILGVVVAMDIFVPQQSMHGATVAVYSQWDKEQMEACRDWVAEKYAVDANRTHSIDYSSARRSREGLNSTNIVINHTLDETGYLSVQLDYVQKYRQSEHCKISIDVPEAYITADVVSGKDVDLEEWLQDGNVSPYQIYVEDNEIGNQSVDLESSIKIKHFISGDMEMEVEQDAEGYLVVQQSYYPGWKVWVDGIKENPVKVNNTFLGVYLEEGMHQIHFVFKPVDFFVGAGITFCFWVVLLIKLVLFIKKKDGESTDVDGRRPVIHG